MHIHLDPTHRHSDTCLHNTLALQPWKAEFELKGRSLLEEAGANASSAQKARIEMRATQDQRDLEEMRMLDEKREREEQRKLEEKERKRAAKLEDDERK